MAMLEPAPTGARPRARAVPQQIAPVHDADPRIEPVAVLALDAVPEAIAAGRHWVTQVARLRGATADVVELLASELLTNAVLYGPRHGDVVVHVERRPGRVRVTVHDDGVGQPAVRAAGPGDESGRGLQLVERLAASWGVHRDPAGGTAVWFETAPLVALNPSSPD